VFVVLPESPMAWTAAAIRERARPTIIGIVIFTFALTAFTTFKNHLQFAVPFFADETLADLDELVHFGDPWRWAHALAPSALLTILGKAYGPFWLVELLAVFLLALLAPNARMRVQYLFTLSVTFIFLGTVVRVFGSSAGPIFYDRLFQGDRFSELTSQLRQSDAWMEMLQISDYLYVSYAARTPGVGTGISAMPSLHVALATLNALVLSTFNRWIALAGWIFATMIMFGSVYFGWHYALDGYLSIAVVVMAWHYAGRLDERLRAPHQ
jgi:hypothetical protein